MSKKNIIVFLIFLFQSSIYSQSSSFKWNTELCSCNGSFDSTKVTREELNNTYKYLWWAPLLKTKSIAWKYEEISKLSVDTLLKEFSFKLSQLQSMKFVDNPFFRELRLKRINELKSIYELKRITILAYNNPFILKEHSEGYKIAKIYADGLIDGDKELMKAWSYLISVRKSRSSLAHKIEEKYRQHFNSQDRFIHAKLEVMMFGWWNHANSTIPYISDRENIRKEFEQLFIEYKCICDEP